MSGRKGNETNGEENAIREEQDNKTRHVASIVFSDKKKYAEDCLISKNYGGFIAKPSRTANKSLALGCHNMDTIFSVPANVRINLQ